MTAPIVFIDTETTSLRPDRRAWEIGLIARVPVVVKHPDGPDTYETQDREHYWFIATEDLDLGNADLMALKVGRFHERHPQGRLDAARMDPASSGAPKREAVVLSQVERLTRDAHLVGAVVSFDAEVLAARMRAHGICPSWNYHLIDCEALAVGYLSAEATYYERRAEPDVAAALRETAGPPWKSDDLAAKLGVTVSEADRHTALGDARFARDVYDAVTGGRP